MHPSSGSGTPLKPVILRPAELPAADRGGGNKTIPLVSGKIGSKQFLNGITRIAQIDKVHAFDDPTSFDVETGKDAFG
jgi:hypothetical protein